MTLKEGLRYIVFPMKTFAVIFNIISSCPFMDYQNQITYGKKNLLANSPSHKICLVNLLPSIVSIFLKLQMHFYIHPSKIKIKDKLMALNDFTSQGTDF